MIVTPRDYIPIFDVGGDRNSLKIINPSDDDMREIFMYMIDKYPKYSKRSY